jgi:hypothetical protein
MLEYLNTPPEAQHAQRNNRKIKRKDSKKKKQQSPPGTEHTKEQLTKTPQNTKEKTSVEQTKIKS